MFFVAHRLPLLTSPDQELAVLDPFVFLLFGKHLPDRLGLFEAIGGRDALGPPVASQGHEIDLWDFEEESQLGNGVLVASPGVTSDEVPDRPRGQASLE